MLGISSYFAYHCGVCKTVERVLISSENFIKNDEYHDMFSSKNQPKDEQGSIKYPHSDVTENQHKRHVKPQCKPFQGNCNS